MSQQLKFMIAAAGREYTYEPLTDAELGIALVESTENLADPGNRMWGVDVLVLRLIDRLTTAEARVTALREARANDEREGLLALTTFRWECRCGASGDANAFVAHRLVCGGA